MIKKFALYSACLAAIAMPLAVRAETVTQKTTVTQVAMPEVRKVDFKAFDINHDGILSRSEVGEELYYLFDQDGNRVIDNKEFTNKAVFTIIPMQSQTETQYDFDDDGLVDSTKYTYTTFTQKSGLARFTGSADGLSPADFTGKGFIELDVNDDKVLDIKEWKGAYIASIDRMNKEAARVNN